MTSFYTYAFLRADGTPYYIGKGKGNRAWVKRHKGVKPPRDKTRILVLKKNLTEEDAFKHEVYMIAVFGRKDLGTGILHNRTNGGDGCSGNVKPPDLIDRMSTTMTLIRQKSEVKEKYEKTFASEEYQTKTSQKSKEVHSRPEVIEKRKKTYSDPEWVKQCSARNSGENNPCHGKLWWVNEQNETKYESECPGPGWQRGRKYKPISTHEMGSAFS